MSLLLDKVQSDPQLKADADRGVIRGPQLAMVELQLRKLHLAGQKRAALNEATTEQQDAQHDREETTSEGTDSGETQDLAEAVLIYYKQLGHMLSCAIDLR